MRLICPNCEAQYEVPDDVIPDAGRDVQCSDCGHTWFQEAAVSARPDPASTFQRAPVPPEVSDILQEEAAFERAARAQDAGSAQTPDYDEYYEEYEDEADFAPTPEPDESSDFLDEDIDNALRRFDAPLEEEETDEQRRTREARERMARMRGLGEAATAAEESRRSALPDVEALNSSLIAAEDVEVDRSDNSIDLEDLNRENRRNSGYRTGFTLMVFVGLLAVALYFTHEGVSNALPAAKPYLDILIAYMDQARFWVADQAALAMTWLDNFVASMNAQG